MGLGPFDTSNTKEGVPGAAVSPFPQKPKKPKRVHVPLTPAIDVGVGADVGDQVTTRVSDEILIQVCDGILKVCVEATKIPLSPYQLELDLRVTRSVVLEDCAELTVLIARQAGKTEAIADIAATLMVLLPTLAQQIPDERLAKFKNGIHIGIFAPSYQSVSILCKRIQDRLYGHGMREVMVDEEIGIEIPDDKTKVLVLPNGSRVTAHTTHPKVVIEGFTYHLIITDESHHIPDVRMRLAIRPTGARTAATIVMLGTAAPFRCEFYDACQRNRRNDLNLAPRDQWKKQHFEYDWKECAKYSRRYKMYVEKERDRLGEDSDEFRMSYRLHWIIERSQFVSSEELNECGLKQNRILRRRFENGKVSTFMCSNNLVTFDSKNRHVAGVDIGRSGDSTVITVSRVWWDNPIKIAERTVYYTHVANWLELHGDDHEKQYPQILSFLQNYRLDCVMLDATGRGDPIYDRLNADLSKFNVPVIPFVFNQFTKHQGYTLFQQEVKHGRFTYPAGRVVQKQTKYRRFKQQFEDLEKGWRGKYMVVEAPKRSLGGRARKDMHDDYPDSAMLTLFATQSKAILHEAEVLSSNPFFESSRNSRMRRMMERRGLWRG